VFTLRAELDTVFGTVLVGRCKALRVTFALSAGMLATVASPAAASVTLGQTGTPGGTCAADFDRLVQTPSSGNTYVSPAAGTITSWSHMAIANPSQILTMKIFRPLGGANYMVVGHDSRPLASGVLNSFPASIAVKAGDFLGLYSNTNNTGCLFGSEPGNVLHTHMGDLGDGQSATFDQPPVTSNRNNISAVLNPSNSFSFGGVSRNKKKGTATLNVDVPNPGQLTGSGKGVSASSAAVTSKSVTAGTAKLPVKAKGKKKRTLNETGKVKVKVNVTYTPTGGDPSTQSRTVKLKKKL
jgi:hypothetical protein